MSHGRHVKILGRGCPARLGNGRLVESALRDLVDLLGMRLLGNPHVYEVETEITKLGVEPFEDEGGVTAVCVLSTSHCSIHTWPLRPYFVMDVFSCRDFDSSVVEQHLVDRLEAYDIQMTDLSASLVYAFDQPATKAKETRKPRIAPSSLRRWPIKKTA